jgi:hypothetical protein
LLYFLHKKKGTGLLHFLHKNGTGLPYFLHKKRGLVWFVFCKKERRDWLLYFSAKNGTVFCFFSAEFYMFNAAHCVGAPDPAWGAQGIFLAIIGSVGARNY